MRGWGHVGEGLSGSGERLGERVWRGGVGGWGEVEWEGGERWSGKVALCAVSTYAAAYLVGEELRLSITMMFVWSAYPLP